MKSSMLKMITGKCWQKLAVTMLVLVGAVASASGAVAPLFSESAKWEFKKNTGEGSFNVAPDKDGKRIGTLEYDFSKAGSTGKAPATVLASSAVNIAEGATEINLQARSAIAQGLTFRLVDSTGQKHQFRFRIKEAGQWVSIKIPLDKKLEHFSGANDGVMHFPIATLVISVPMPADGAKTGKVEFADVKAP